MPLFRKILLWEACIRNMIQDGCGMPVFVELGPGKQLKAMLRRIDREAFKRCLNFDPREAANFFQNAVYLWPVNKARSIATLW